MIDVLPKLAPRPPPARAGAVFLAHARARGIPGPDDRERARPADVLLRDGVPVRVYPVSTSKFGVGDRPGSNRTPIGRMEVARKIGGNRAPGRCSEPPAHRRDLAAERPGPRPDRHAHHLAARHRIRATATPSAAAFTSTAPPRSGASAGRLPSVASACGQPMSSTFTAGSASVPRCGWCADRSATRGKASCMPAPKGLQTPTRERHPPPANNLADRAARGRRPRPAPAGDPRPGRRGRGPGRRGGATALLPGGRRSPRPW